MPCRIGITDEHVELAASLRRWAAGLARRRPCGPPRASPTRRFAEVWKAVGEMGVPTIGLPESAGGGGGTPLDLAVALEACAHELLPGPLLGPAVAASLLGDDRGRRARSVRRGRRPRPGRDVVWDAPAATHLLVADAEDGWFLVPPDGVDVTPAPAST